VFSSARGNLAAQASTWRPGSDASTRRGLCVENVNQAEILYGIAALPEERRRAVLAAAAVDALRQKIIGTSTPSFTTGRLSRATKDRLAHTRSACGTMLMSLTNVSLWGEGVHRDVQHQLVSVTRAQPEPLDNATPDSAVANVAGCL
jgi:hypothetical protein